MTVKANCEDLNAEGISGAEEAIVLRTRVLPNPLDLYRALTGRIFKLLGWEKQFEERNVGWSDPTPSNESLAGAAKRLMLSLLYTPDECQGWLPFAIEESPRAIRTHPIRYVISTGLPFTAHLVGLAVKKLCSVRWVADFRDPWSWNEQKAACIRSPLADQINQWLEETVVQNADQVVSVTPATLIRSSLSHRL